MAKTEEGPSAQTEGLCPNGPGPEDRPRGIFALGFLWEFRARLQRLKEY